MTYSQLPWGISSTTNSTNILPCLLAPIGHWTFTTSCGLQLPRAERYPVLRPRHSQDRHEQHHHNTRSVAALPAMYQNIFTKSQCSKSKPHRYEEALLPSNAIHLVFVVEIKPETHTILMPTVIPPVRRIDDIGDMASCHTEPLHGCLDGQCGLPLQ